MVMGSARLGPKSKGTANYRPFLSSEKEPHFNIQAVVRLKNRKEKEPNIKKD
jgi:hypothetical protein